MLNGLKIAMLTNGYYPRIGGAERQVGDIASRLHGKGASVDVITREFPGAPRFEVVDGIQVHRLPAHGLKPVASISYTFCSLRLLKKIKPDIIHAHELFSTTTTAVLAKGLFARPVVATPHSSGYFGDVYRLQHKFLGKLRLSIFREYVDSFTTISQKVGQELSLSGVKPEKLVYIPNAVDTQKYCSSKNVHQTRLLLRAQLGIPSDSLIVVFAGRLSDEKRPGNLTKAWRRIFEECPNTHLVILGSGKLEAEIKSTLPEGAFLLGEVIDILPYLQGSDLFVLPSAAEGLPVSLLEAMACGLPCVATNVGGVPEVIQDEENGLLVQPDDIEALAKAIIELLGNPNERKKMGLNNRARVENRFSLDLVIENLENLYSRLVEQRGRPR